MTDDMITSSGLILRDAERPSSGSSWSIWLAAPALLLTTVGCLCSVIGMRTALPAVCAGIAVLLLYLPLKEKRWANRFLKPALLPLVCAGAVIGRRFTLNGFALIVNRLFAISEANQSYEYDRLAVTVSADQELFCILWAVALVSLLWAILSIWLMPRQLWLLSLTAAGGFASAVAYFGVAPAFWWGISLAAACVLPLIGERARIPSVLPALAVLLLLCLAVLPLPKENARISALDETLRDRMAFHTVQYDAVQEPIEIPKPKPKEKKKPQEQWIQNQFHSVSDLPNLKYWILAALILTVLLILLIPSILADRLNKRIERNRAGMDDVNCSAAIHAMFLYAVQWLRASGVEPGNVNFTEWTLRLADTMPEGYSERYLKVVPLWQEAAFSGHVLSEAQRETMYQFLRETGQAVWDRATLRQRMQIRFRYALRLEDQV